MFSCIAVSERGLVATGNEDFYSALDLKQKYVRIVCHFGHALHDLVSAQISVALEAKANVKTESQLSPWVIEDGFCFELRHLDGEQSVPVLCCVRHDEIIIHAEKAPDRLLETWSSLFHRDHLPAKNTAELLYFFLLDLYSRISGDTDKDIDLMSSSLKTELFALTFWIQEEVKKYGALCEARFKHLSRLLLV